MSNHYDLVPISLADMNGTVAITSLFAGFELMDPGDPEHSFDTKLRPESYLRNHSTQNQSHIALIESSSMAVMVDDPFYFTLGFFQDECLPAVF